MSGCNGNHDKGSWRQVREREEAVVEVEVFACLVGRVKKWVGARHQRRTVSLDRS